MANGQLQNQSQKRIRLADLVKAMMEDHQEAPSLESRLGSKGPTNTSSSPEAKQVEEERSRYADLRAALGKQLAHNQKLTSRIEEAEMRHGNQLANSES